MRVQAALAGEIPEDRQKTHQAFNEFAVHVSTAKQSSQNIRIWGHGNLGKSSFQGDVQFIDSLVPRIHGSNNEEIFRNRKDTALN